MNFWDELMKQRQEAKLDLDDVALRRKLLQKQNGLCHWCHGGMQPFDRTLDHLLPHSMGGPYISANLVLAHRSCNARRGSRFSMASVEKLPDLVLALAIENLQTLKASAYEAVSESQGRVLKKRQEMEPLLWEMLVLRLRIRQEKFLEELEPLRQHRADLDRAQQSEISFRRLVTQLQNTKIGQRILRHEHQKKLTLAPARAEVIRRRKKE